MQLRLQFGSCRQIYEVNFALLVLEPGQLQLELVVLDSDPVLELSHQGPKKGHRHHRPNLQEMSVQHLLAPLL